MRARYCVWLLRMDRSANSDEIRNMAQTLLMRQCSSCLAVAASVVLTACSGSSSGSGSGSAGSPATTGAHSQLAEVDYGRLVDVYGLLRTSQGVSISLFQKDVLIGPDIQDERQVGGAQRDEDIRFDFISSDPDTLQGRLFVTREIGTPAFQQLFDSLDNNVRSLTPLAFSTGNSQTYTVVPRNAALRLKFTRSLGITDDFFVERNASGQVTGIRNADAVQLLQLSGDPSVPGSFVPITTRYSVFGDTLILDPVLLGTEGLQYQTRNNASGLPEAPNQVGANIRLAIALEGPLAIPGMRADSLGSLTGLNNSGRSAVIRDFRSGNALDASADISGGFVRDPIPPRIIGEMSMYLERVDPVNANIVQITVFKGGIIQEIDRGDVFRIISDNSGVPFGSAEVLVDPADDLGQPEVQHVRVLVRFLQNLENIDPSNRPGYPQTPSEIETWLVLNAPRAVLVAEFNAGGLDPLTQEFVGDDPRNFVTFSPSPLPYPDGRPSEPNQNISPFAGAVIRFTKPVDGSTIKAADTMFFGTRNLLDQDAIQQFIATRPWRRLAPDGTTVTAQGIGMDLASFDRDKFWTPHLVAARVVDEDGSQTTLRLQPSQGFYLDQQMRQDGNRPYYLHLVGGAAGIRDLSGNPVDLQATDPTRSSGLAIPFTLDLRTNGAVPAFDDNLVVSVVRRFANQDEDENPSLYIDSEVQGQGSDTNARAYRLQDIFGAFVQVGGKLQARPTTRVRQIADNLNQAPVAPQTSLLRWCPYSVSNEDQVSSNTSTTPFGQGIQNPLNPYGARLQTVWREVDLSLSRVDPFDFNLDVEQMYWAPFASGTITFDEFDQLGLFLGHSERRPEPCVGNFAALPTFEGSGLRTDSFDKNYLRNLLANGSGEQVDTRPLPFSAYPPSAMRIDSAQTVLEPNGVNRFLPLPRFQKPYFVFRDETVIEQGCVSGLGSDTATSIYSPWLISPWLNGMGRRVTQGYQSPGVYILPTGAGTFDASQPTIISGFWNDCVNAKLRTAGTADSFTEGLVGSIACPLLADFWTFCDRADLPAGSGYIAQGTNGWQTSITVQSSPVPNFRVLSSGRAGTSSGQASLCLTTGAAGWNQAIGGYVPNTTQPTAAGDNTLYWIMIDFLKRQSVLTSGFVDLFNPHRMPSISQDSRLGPYFTDPLSGVVALPQNILPAFTYEFEPSLSEMPSGTTVVAQFRAASIVDPTPWYWTEWASPQAPAISGVTLYPAQIRNSLKPDASNFPLDPYKAGDAHIRKYDDRLVNGVSKNFWTYLYNRTLTTYASDPNTLMDAQFLARFGAPAEGFSPRSVRYVNWRFLMSNNTEANPPVAPAIETFSFSYRFQRVR